MDRRENQASAIPMDLSSSFPPILDAAKSRMMSTVPGGSNGIGCGNFNGPSTEEIRLPSEVKVKKPVRYIECQKNHAASLGGHALDGCGEFMPSGEEGTIEALKCAACDCHRNFHRREVEGETSCSDCQHGYREMKRPGPLIRAAPLAHGSLSFPSSSMLARPSSQMIMALSSGPLESDELEGSLLSPQSFMFRKRFRTKFTVEQREKMLAFAENVGWRIQKHDEAAVQEFCADIGVKRHVLKVWMHNNKSTLGSKKT